ncbi:MAG: methyltransferase domain-containing protein, partial [Magnetospirillum sp.]|nr:methyltransferase domain-containing protein [Magnetospirillum sp.]
FVPPNGLVVEIGSNDGILLRSLQSRDVRVLGVDPARNVSEQARAQGVPTLTAYFGEAVARAIAKEHGPAAAIIANNVFAHIDDLGGVVDGIADLLAPEGVFVFEVSYLVDVFEKTLFDTIYHEHLDYHSVGPLIGFFRAHGMELIEALRIDSHGGSLRGVARLAAGTRPVGASVAAALAEEARLGLDRAATLQAFGAKIAAIGTELNAVLKGFKAQGLTIAGFGAPAKATTLLYHFAIGPELIDFIVDDSPLKQGLFSPGMHIPVVPSAAIAEKNPDVLVVLAWNFAAPIVAKNAAFRAAGGRFVIPLPKVEVLS